MEPRLDQIRSGLARWLLGFFGTVLGFLVLPKLFRFTARRFLFGFIAEVVTIMLAGLLTEKAVEMLERKE
ncbi:MAG: hypothetical protein D6685_12155 [Bacteroidetes bacterium]|nr:hypothetical protein AWN76_000715 [Rhodothermaceae bacterium RA]RMH58244.1 MAG: hypothetical protein D6685_12155 [Bacteroidota bacterium]